MTRVGSRFICNNDDCGYVEFPGQLVWYEAISKNESLWNHNVIKKSPSIIAFEYESLYEMMRDGEISGVRIKIKDVFEVILKFAVLVILSQVFNDDSRKDNKKNIGTKTCCKKYQYMFNNALLKLTNTLPSLGTWVSVAEEILKNKDVEPKEIMSVLEDIVKVYDKNRITHWRNEKVGHGAYTSVENESLKNDIREKIDVIADHFNRNETIYCTMHMLSRQRNEFINLEGADKARNTGLQGNNLYLEFQDRKFALLPLIRNIDGSLFFFDSYIKATSSVEYLNYYNGDKKRIKEESVKSVVKSLRKVADVITADSSAERDIFVREHEEAIERIVRPDYFSKFNFITDKLKKLITNHSKGFYLLQMEDGMGKTTYVKMLDSFGYNKTKIDKKILHRAFYINSVYSYSKLTFIQVLKDALRLSNDNCTLVGDIPEISLNNSDCKRQIADLINTLTDRQKELFGIEKLVFFIDGLDEIPNAEKDSFISLIPDKKNLNDGVFLIFTSRINEQLNNFSKKILSQIDFDETLIITHDNYDYCNELKELINKYTNADDVITNEILSLANGRIINIWPLISGFNQLGEKGLVQAEKGLLDYLLSIYGEIYFQEIMRIIYALKLVQVPITLNVLMQLIGENVITFKQLAYLGEIKSIINIDHNTDGYLLSVTRPELIEYVNNDVCVKGIDKLKKMWLEGIDDLVTSDVEYKDIKSHSILTHMIEFIAMVDDEKGMYLNTLTTKEYGEKLLQIFAEKIAIDKRNIKDWEYLVLKKLFNVYTEKYIPITFEKKINLSSMLMINLLIQLSDVVGMLRGELDFTIELLEKFLKYMKEYKVQIVAFIMCPIYGQLAALYSKKDDYVNARKYFELTSQTLKDKKLCKDFCKVGQAAVYDYLQFEMFAKYTLADAIYDKNRGKIEVALKKLKSIENYYTVIEKSEFSKTAGFLSYKLNVTKTIGNIYKHTQVEKALKLFKDAEIILNEIKLLNNKSEIYRTMEYDLQLNLGQCYRKMRNYDEALSCYHKALDDIEWFKLNGKMVDVNYEPNILKSIGNIFLDKKDFQQALLYYKRSEELYINMKETNLQYDKTPYIQLCASISTCYRELGDVDNAEKYKRYTEATYSNSYAYELSEDDYYFGNVEFIKKHIEKNKQNILQDRKDSLHLWSWDISSEKYNSPVLYLGEVYCPIFRRTGRLFDAFLNNPHGPKVRGELVKDSIRFIDLDLIIKRIKQTNLSPVIKDKLISLYSEVDEDFLFVGYKVGEKMLPIFDNSGYEKSRKKDYENAEFLNISWDLEKINDCCRSYLESLKSLCVN